MSAPTIFQSITPSTLQRRCDEYFDSVKKKKGTASITGLALHLGCTRKNISDYIKTDAYGKILEKAKLQCENILEEKMINGTPPTGIIFILKNNYGWKDKVEVDQTINGTISLATLFDRASQAKKLEESNIIDIDNIQTETLASSENPEEEAESPLVSLPQVQESSEQDSDQLPDSLF